MYEYIKNKNKQKKRTYDYRTKEKTLVYDWEKVCEHELIIFQSYGSM